MNAIILHAHIVGLGVIRALGEMNVPITVMHYEKIEMGHLSRFVQERIHVPDPRESEEKFIQTILDHASHLRGGVLFPCNDYIVVALSRHKEKLQEFYKVAIPEWDIIKKAIIKKHTYDLAEKLGVPFPKTCVLRSAEDIKKVESHITYPCIMKPCEGHKFYDTYGKKMVRVKNEKELLVSYDKASSLGLEVMAQEYIPGDDHHGVNYNSYFWEGVPLAEFTAEKVRSAPPLLGFPRVVVSKSLPDVVALGRRMLRGIGFYGYSCMEFKRDARNGIYKLMEVNPRNNLSTSLAVTCGINFPWMIYRHLLYNEIINVNQPKYNVYWIDIIKDLVHSIRCRREERYSLSKYLKPYFNPKVFAVFRLDDPLPFLKRCCNGFYKIPIYMYRLLFKLKREKTFTITKDYKKEKVVIEKDPVLERELKYNKSLKVK
jgi:predicted ATP-grasp superfamily ATP-dependent carboligase